MTASITTVEFAKKSAVLVASITPLLQAMSFPPDMRIHYALSLVKSSIDIGHAAITLIATDESFNGMGALVLMRPQLEHFFRGIYLGTPSLSTDGFVTQFSTGKAEFPCFQDMSNHAANVLSKVPMGSGTKAKEFERLPNMIQFVKKSLNGFVHGGIKVVDAYDHPTGIAFNVEHFDNGHTIINITSIAVLGLSFVQSLSSPPSAHPDGNLAGKTAIENFMKAYGDWRNTINDMLTV